ncbi:maleylpyruvate isomerase family mycothiol-dependent enzyme [Spirillospora sp. NPDC047279]|uniref:maleylpyruvate isomerase family mycothiol-dependent enzyme n=1 Tax=Spirillospora sp. NPDC047279 TaxID=3155478 RepID=UPI0033D62C12
MSEEGHLDVNGSLAAWALDACPADEAARVAAHLAECARCAREAARLQDTTSLLATATAAPPPPALRSKVLAAARRRRAPGALAGPVTEPAAAYAAQVDLMDDLLMSLTLDLWRAPLKSYGSVLDLVTHLTGNDVVFAADVGLPRPAIAQYGPHIAWNTQARAIVEGVSTGGVALLERDASLAGAREVRAPGRSALVQRTFETWTHADDIRAIAGRPAVPPPPEHLRLIVDLGTGLLPRALRFLGRERPGLTARLVLTGPGAGVWSVPLAFGGEPGSPDITITADAEDFCRLLAGRRTPATFAHESDGDPAVVADVLHAASTLGCD